MSKVAKKKEVLLTKKERLLKELAELDSTIESVVEEEWKEQGELIMNNIDALLELVPTHDDGSVDEGHDDPNCLKCVLLAAKSNDKWDYKKYGLSIELETREITYTEAVNGIKTVVTTAAKEEVTKKRGRPPKKEKKLSDNQKKAEELGLLKPDGTPKRVLQVNEDDVDLPDNWGM